MTTSKPTRLSTVRPRTSTMFAVSYRPVAVTLVQVASSAGAGPAVPAPPLGAGTASRSGAGVIRSPASIRSLITVRPSYRSICQLPSITITAAATMVSARMPSQRGVRRNRYTR